MNSNFTKCDTWSIIHTNIRGYVSKALSLQTISSKDDVVTINETLLKNAKKLTLPGFTCFNLNRQGCNGGGIATCVKDKDSINTLKVFEGANDNEVLITRHGQFETAINVINIYGSQECRTSKDKILENWGIVLQEISKIESKDELVCMIGDFNRHIGGIIEGNDNDKVTFGGQLVLDLVNTGKYCLVNTTKYVVGGPFTRYDPSDPHNNDKKSVLELCIVSKELLIYVDTLTIDKERNFTPFRPIGKSKRTYTDHYSLRLLFKNIPLKPVNPVAAKKVIRWNTNKEGGWKTYTEMTSNNARLIDIANNKFDEPDTIMKNIDKEMKSVKFKAFGKAKERAKPIVDKENDALKNEKEKLLSIKEKKNEVYIDEKIKDIDDKMTAKLLKTQREQFEKELCSLREVKTSKGMSAAVFKLKEKIVGPKSTKQEATVLIDPQSNLEVNTPEDIKRISLQYCVDLLTNRKPKDEFAEDIFLKDVVHLVRMEEEVNEEYTELTVDMFEKTYDILRKRKGSKYDFIMKGGAAMKAALFQLCQSVWFTEKLPKIWDKSTLVQLFKMKGSRSILDNMRHLHIKDEFPKFFGHLVVSASKDKMISGLTKYQIATKPGHRAGEHLFVLKSVIALYMMTGRAIILSMWDLSKFFDRESLTDCMNELYKSKVQGKLYRLLYAMNKNTRICVQTPVGLTEEHDTGEGVGQGTLEGALVSAVSLDAGVNEFFSDSEYEVSYGKVPLQPILFQDDVARLALDPESAQMGNDKMETLAETKLLNYNMDKSCYMVIGKLKARNEMQKQLQNCPLTLCGSNMKEEKSAKYLGDWLSCLGLADSVDVTVKKRKGLVSLAIYEIRAVIDDLRSQVCGGLTAGLDIWELAVLPKLLYNAESWQEISKNTVQVLEDLQLQFYRCMMAVGSGCPIPSLYLETGGTLIQYRILQKKLLFLHHVATLPDDSLAKEVFQVQEELNLPGLVQDCRDFLIKGGITCLTKYSKNQWKALVKSEIAKLNKDDILQKTKGYKKISYEELSKQPFMLQPYMKTLKISDARLRFKLKTFMTPTIQMNFPSDSEFADQLWTCTGCANIGSTDQPSGVTGQRDTQTHVLICPGYAELRQGMNLDEDSDLVKYFSLVIKRRLDIEDC